MRFMMLVIPKGYEKAAPGTMPDSKKVEEMMKYNESLQKAGVLLSPAAALRTSIRWSTCATCCHDSRDASACASYPTYCPLAGRQRAKPLLPRRPARRPPPASPPRQLPAEPHARPMPTRALTRGADWRTDTLAQLPAPVLSGNS